MKHFIYILTLLASVLSGVQTAASQSLPTDTVGGAEFEAVVDSSGGSTQWTDSAVYADFAPMAAPAPMRDKDKWVSPYALPYSTHRLGQANWHRMWINTAVLSSAFVATLFVLEMLPEDATAWNRAAIQQTPMFERWYKNIFVHNPEIDHDKFIFNYILHPYAGAVYFLGARSCGFSFWGSMLYSFCISTIGWEFGIEAFMERPSYQDIFITPCVGSALGELMYRGKRAIIERGYDVLGHQWMGRTICFLLDPVNEVIDLFRGNPCHEIARDYRAKRTRIESSLSLTPWSLSLAIRF